MPYGLHNYIRIFKPITDQQIRTKTNTFPSNKENNKVAPITNNNMKTQTDSNKKSNWQNDLCFHDAYRCRVNMDQETNPVIIKRNKDDNASIWNENEFLNCRQR
jgi:hypothetical protein